MNQLIIHPDRKVRNSVYFRNLVNNPRSKRQWDAVMRRVDSLNGDIEAIYRVCAFISDESGRAELIGVARKFQLRVQGLLFQCDAYLGREIENVFVDLYSRGCYPILLPERKEAA